MKFTIEREILLKPLQLAAGVVERKQTLPVLANVLLSLKKQELVLVGTDLEIELRGRINLTHPAEAGDITVPAHKLVDICRALPEQSLLEVYKEGQKLIIRSGRSRFNLATLDASGFPVCEVISKQLEFSLPQAGLRKLIESTAFAMAQQDVRYYLNGMSLEVGDNYLRAMATDGHRMALSVIDGVRVTGLANLIIPRKSVLELSRLLLDTDEEVIVSVGTGQLHVQTDGYTFTSKLIDGQYPSHDKVIPRGGDKILVVDRDALKQALTHVATLANDKYRSVRMELQPGVLRLSANNMEREEAEEELNVEYQGDNLDIGFNVNYLCDAVAALPAGNIQLTLSDPDSSVRIEGTNGDKNVYVVMPMRL